MKFSKMLITIDTHTEGEPTRVVIAGLPFIKADSMAAVKQSLAEKYDYIRTTLMLEPRGHRDMFGAMLFPPRSPAADFGVVFMDAGGYLNMCGHGSIGVVVAAAEVGLVEITAPRSTITMDTPAGLVKAEVSSAGGKVQDVSIINVPAFAYLLDYKLGDLHVGVSYGGNFFLMVDINQLGLRIEPANARPIALKGMEILARANAEIKVQHPTEKHINSIDLVEFYDPAEDRNVVIFGATQVDRSPCGTGTSAKMAYMHAQGKLREGDVFYHRSIIDTVFKGRIVGTTQVGDYAAIIPEITARAYVTGINHYVIDDEDRWKHGFLV